MAENILTDDQRVAAAERVLIFVQHRFKTVEAAEHWLRTGSISGFGSATPLELIGAGREEWIYEAIKAMDAGVFA